MCLFCDIAQGRLDSPKIYEDENICVFPDISPKAPTHLLMIPKIHIQDLRDLDTAEKREAVSHLMNQIPKIVHQWNIGDFQLLCRNGKEAGQEVFHLHFHLLSQTPLTRGN